MELIPKTGQRIEEGHFPPVVGKGHVPVAEEDVAYHFLCNLIEKGFLSKELERLLTMD